MTELLSYFKTRATRRAFDPDRHISRQLLRELCEAAAHAPNTGNMQLYTAIATMEPEAKVRLAQLHFGQPAATGADVIVTVCADTRRFDAWCRARKAEGSFDNFGGRLTAMTDAVIFTQQLVTAAENAGLGTCYLGTVTYNADAIKEFLRLPDGVVPVTAISMGYPAPGSVAAPSDRLPVDAILHFEGYEEPSEAEIDTWYAEKEALPESDGFIAENGLETLAQVYARVRYPQATNEALGRSMFDLMRARDEKF